jgi:hypothetical protein
VQLQDQVAPRQAEFGQCSGSVGRGSATGLLPRHERLCLVQGCKRDCMVRLHASSHPWISNGAGGTMRGSPASMFSDLLRYESFR